MSESKRDLFEELQPALDQEAAKLPTQHMRAAVLSQLESRPHRGLYLGIALAAAILLVFMLKSERDQARPTTERIVADTVAELPRPRTSAVENELGAVSAEQVEPITERATVDAPRRRSSPPRPEPEAIALPSEEVPDWKGPLERAAFAEAVSAVEAIGVEGVASSAGADELLALAEAALNIERRAVAQTFFDALERRFASSESAAIASYRRGQLAALDGERARAADHFSTYLQRRPDGRLAREARGRLIELLSQEGQRVEARRAATDYLQRYPSGPHVPLARRVLRESPQ